MEKQCTKQNLQNAAKVVLRGKFTAINMYTNNKERSQINNLILYLRQLEKKNKLSPKFAEGRK